MYNNGQLRNKIHFNTSYTLRPNSYNSFLFGNAPSNFSKTFFYDGFFNNPTKITMHFQDDNKTAGSLTLNSITQYDKNGNTLPPISFEYISYNPNAWPLITINPAIKYT